jgi:ligand-binding SRPBCC domain-containing protein
MPIIKLSTEIHAPIERVFDLARSIDLHQQSMGHTGEKAIGGRMSGLIELGETVTWEAVHFGLKQRLTSQITVCEAPIHLQDVMVTGSFKRFTHDHYFSETGSGTMMKDVFDYDSPFGFLGLIADLLFLESYMTRLLEKRNQLIKKVAEGEGWRDFLPDG